MTDQVSPDWVSMVSAAQATRAPAVITATQTWTGEELLARAAGAARWLSGAALPARVPLPSPPAAGPRRRRGPLAVGVRTARRDSRTCPAAGEPRGARPGAGRRRRQAADRAARPPADRARAGRLRRAPGRAVPAHAGSFRGHRDRSGPWPRPGRANRR